MNLFIGYGRATREEGNDQEREETSDGLRRTLK